MSDITLTSAVRSNLLSLQNTADLLGRTQERLSTGKKVNTALDNPSNFFTAQGLDSRASDLSKLLDSVSNGVQVLKAADAGITGLQKLIDSAKSTARSALQSTNSYTTKANKTATVQAGATEDDVRGTAVAAVTSTSQGTVAIATDAALQALSGAINLDDGAGHTATYTIGGASTKAALTAALSTNGFTASFDGADKLVITRADGKNFTAGGAGATATGSPNGTGGSLAIATLDAKVLTVTNSSGKTATVTFGTAAGQVKTLADLNTALAAADVQASVTSDGKLSITTTNASGADTFTLSGTAAEQAFGAAVGASVTSSAVTFDANAQVTRSNLRKDYNELLNQISKLAQDSSFNGVNLLNGDDLSVIFNEKGNSKLDIKGVTFDATSLGLAQITDTDFLDGSSINAVLDKLNTATNTLRAQGAKFGSNLSIVQTRQEFSKNLINVLSTGSANLTLADVNEEGANYSALNTRQQLSTTALALSGQSQQLVLQLLR
jgi:flagellin